MLREAHPRHGNVETLLLPALKDRASVADGVGERMTTARRLETDGLSDEPSTGDAP